jgi:hypothetical protein
MGFQIGWVGGNIESERETFSFLWKNDGSVNRGDMMDRHVPHPGNRGMGEGLP